MDRKKHTFHDFQSGTAITIRFVSSHQSIGFGGKLKDGVVDFYYPDGVTMEKRKQTLVSSLIQLFQIEKSQIEVITGSGDMALVTMLGITSEAVNKKFFN
ncbi:MAG: hypothetical protein CVU39_02780 [Chloroflexi bacterium HGW-Chloroflexi-10]|nr:MAG: hypothetical protein CVU39_02780 [Chloroflexi bacterium HGW-Chloroflexi-10]